MRKSNQLDNSRRIALVGFSGPNQAMLEYCFSSAGDCELVAPAQAAVLIVNGDQTFKDDELQQDLIARYPDVHKIVISIRDLHWPSFKLVKKPHSSQDLLDAVRAFPLPGQSKPSDNADSPAQKENKSEDLLLSLRGSKGREQRSEALKQKLIRGKMVVSASDRLVQKLEAEIKEKEAREEAERQKQREAQIARLKAQKLEELKQKKLEEKRRLAAEKARLLEQQLEARKQAQQQAQLQALKQAESQAQLQEQSQVPPKVQQSELTEAAVSSVVEEAIIAESPIAALTPAEIQQCCGNAADVDLSRADEKRIIFFNPEGSLLVKMTEALELTEKLEQPIEITGLPGKMYIFPQGKQFYTSFDDDFLNQLALTRFGYGELDLLPLGPEFELAEDHRLTASEGEGLVWKVALWTAKGRIFYGMDPEKPVQLQKRPDFETFQRLPSGEEISEVWSGHSLSAIDVTRILDVPQRVVFAFMSGAYSLGWFQG